LDALFDDVLAAAMKIAEADAATLQLLDEPTQQLRLAATTGLADALAAQFSTVGRDSNSSCGIALATGQRAVVRYAADGSAPPSGAQSLLAEDGFVCAQSTPLVSRSGRTLGMFSTHWRTERVLAERELRFFDLLARQAADLIERIRDEQALRASEQQLRESARRKDEFLAVLAHELRNPLAALSAAAHLLGKKSQNVEVATIARDALQRQIGHMARLLDDLLDVARITHGRLQLRTECVDVRQLLEALTESMQPQFTNKQQHLTLDGETGPIFAQADPIRLSQIIGNLLSNSLKYTPAGGRIALELRMEQQRVVIRVQDNGIGIASDLLPRIFEMFAQGSHASGGSAGLGIGLSLAKGLVELHGGSIEARSAGEGRGSEFIVTLPALIPEDEASSAAAAADDAVAKQPLRILVADDNSDNALSLGIILEEQGHTVRTAFDGKSALEEAERFRPQVALLDIGMPHLNGYEVARSIRGSAWGQSAVLIAMTGWGQARDKEDARAAGFDHHLTKPASVEDIEAVLKLAAQGSNSPRRA
jgi:signal transduction histidine kinase/ActR/RegA family two-component response regulator